MKSTICRKTDIELGYLKYPEIAYHYTSPSGLKGILNNLELWFTRYDFLNDVNEGKYIVSIYEKAINELQSTGVVDNKFIDAIKDAKPKYYCYVEDKETIHIDENGCKTAYGYACKTEPYICCFSLEKDSLPMWNYYSKNDKHLGYNIGFDIDSLVNTEDCEIRRVIYDEREQIEIVFKSFRYSSFLCN